jgi:toxin YoeB
MTLAVKFDPEAWDDYFHWQKTDKALAKRINELIAATQRDPFVGIGKPEPLKHAFAGWWSRRINDEHRMVYRAKNETIEIAKLRYHYSA